mmetsp:Transcript_22499/g.62412  ORF Transcript_22499/g.62412 Transcript_22499/m.62412 type:complete len:545 (-) Transcript_22499:123-1757(-)
MSPAAASAEPTAGQGYHAEAIKTIDETTLLIPSQLNRGVEDGDAFPEARTLGFAETLGRGGRTVLESDGKSGLSGQQIAECARLLGIDVIFDTDILYIAEELLTSPLPDNWESYTAAGGRVYYYNLETRVTQWAHPLEDYYRSLVFMRKEGDAELEKKALDNPPTPEEVREMAKYMGIDYQNEFGLLEIAKAAVNAPLLPEWENFEDENGEIYYFNKITKVQCENHPLDGFFIEVIRQRREELKQGHQVPLEPEVTDFWSINEESTPYPWMEFVDRHTGALYYYNFHQDAICHYHPAPLIRHQLRSKAAVKIQALYRGFFIRHTNQQLVMMLAAKDIQRIWRGHKVRKGINFERNKKQMKSASAIQALWRGRKVRVDRFMELQQVNAVRIQAKWRALVDKKKVERAAAKSRLPEIACSPMHAKVMPPHLGVRDALARVSALSEEFLQFSIPAERPLDSVNANGEPILFPWLRIPPNNRKATGGSGKRRPSRGSASAGSRRSAEAGREGAHPPADSAAQQKQTKRKGKKKTPRPKRQDNPPPKGR